MYLCVYIYIRVYNVITFIILYTYIYIYTNTSCQKQVTGSSCKVFGSFWFREAPLKFPKDISADTPLMATRNPVNSPVEEPVIFPHYLQGFFQYIQGGPGFLSKSGIFVWMLLKMQLLECYVGNWLRRHTSVLFWFRSCEEYLLGKPQVIHDTVRPFGGCSGFLKKCKPLKVRQTFSMGPCLVSS